MKQRYGLVLWAGVVTNFSTVSRAHLRRAGPDGPGREQRGRTRAIKGEERPGWARHRQLRFNRGSGRRGAAASLAPSGRKPYGAAAAELSFPGDRPQAVPAVPPRCRSRQQRPSRHPRARCADRREKDHIHRAGTPRIVRVGPSTRKGTRRSFLTAPQNLLRRKHLRDPPLRAETSADPAGLTAGARPKARPDRCAANLREQWRTDSLPM
jgi:hypothetical protein